MYYPLLSPRWFKQKAKSSYARVTLNWCTALFFIFSHLYCFAQGMIQSLLFNIDVQYGTLVNAIVHVGHIPDKNMTFLQGSPGHLHLQMCNGVPNTQSPYPCTTIFNSSTDSPINNPSLSAQPVHFLKAWQGARPIVDKSSNLTSLVLFTQPEPIFLTSQCIQILQYPSQILRNFRREDITWISLQFWLLSISFIAIASHSIPHVLAVLSSRILSAAWATYAIWRGPYFKSIFHQLLADPGTPCSLDLFTDYWNKRQVYQLANLVLSCTGLLVFAYLSWSLLKTYGAQSFKCVGPPEHITRLHKALLALFATLQLGIFVLIAGTALWIDILTGTAISHITIHTTIYETLYVILFLPWIAMGWYAIRHEMKRTMIFFLLIGLTIISGWCVMFSSAVFQWSFLQWPFLACFTVFSFILILVSMILGVVCRLNFGQGLREYLRAEATLSALNFAPDSFPYDRSSSASCTSKVKLTAASKHQIHRSATKSELSSRNWGFSTTTLKIPSDDDLYLKLPSPPSNLHMKSPSSSSTLKSSTPPTWKGPPSFPSLPSPPSESKFESEFEEGGGKGRGGSERPNAHDNEITSVHLDLDEYFMQDREFSSGKFKFGGGFNDAVEYVGYVGGGVDGSGIRYKQQQEQQRYPAEVVYPALPSLPLTHSSPRPRELASEYTIGKDWKEGGGWEEDSEMGLKSPVPF